MGKQDPPKPMPGLRKCVPIRWSRPIPRATSSTFAPVSSHTLAISLMNEILVARNALAASLIISALGMSVRSSVLPSGAYSSATASPAQSPSSPTTTRSGSRKSCSADPSLRNSGHDTYAKLGLPPSLKIRLIAAPVPTGTVDFITSAWRSEAGIALTTALTAERSASPE